MVIINTNLASLIAQKSLKISTNKLNLAIDRLTTGAKINHASDDAAGYSIVNSLNTKISAYQVAEDNVLSGIDMLDTMTSALDLIKNNLDRLTALQQQVMNNTLGEDSLNAINAECKSLVDSIQHTYATTEYNGISLLQTQYSTEEVFADENTTLEQLGIGRSSFSIYDSNNNLVRTYDTETDSIVKIGDFLGKLRGHGFTAEINDGKITLESADFYYISGGLADAFGISTATKNIITTTTQSSTSPASYVLESEATGNSTFAQIGVLNYGTSTVNVRNADGTLAGNVIVNSDMQLNTFFSRLTGYNISGSINDGIITLTSSDGSYLELNSLRRIGLDKETDFLSRLNDLTRTINTKQTEIGAVQNRLYSAVESIGVMYDNLVTTRSTLRDADVAQVSSQYIKAQILQQASATLLATANQSPAVALALI